MGFLVQKGYREGGSPITQDRSPQGCQMEIWELGNPEIWDFIPLGLRSKNLVFERLAHNRATFSRRWAEIDGVHINFSKSAHFCQQIMRAVVLTDLELGSCSRIRDFSNLMLLQEFATPGWAFSTHVFCCGNSKNWIRTCLPNIKFPKSNIPSIQNVNELILS